MLRLVLVQLLDYMKFGFPENVFKFNFASGNVKGFDVEKLNLLMVGTQSGKSITLRSFVALCEENVRGLKIVDKNSDKNDDKKYFARVSSIDMLFLGKL